jgi:hypothetical protein
MKKRMIISESEREKILSMHKKLIQSTWGINEAEEDEINFDIQDEPSSDLTVEKFGPLVYLTGNGEKFMGSEIDGGWEFYNAEDVIVTMEEMCGALGCSLEELKDTVGIDDEAEEIDAMVDIEDDELEEL